ncbi:MAG: PilZ domain [Candidatus Hydrogenedentota bacterium]
MNDPIYIFPQATSGTYLTVLAIAVGMFVAAVLLVRRQRRGQERARLAAEWAGVETIIKEKELGPEEREVLKKLLRNRAPEHPYRAITQRAAFDEMLREEIASGRAGKGVDEFNALGEMWRGIRCSLGLDFIPVGFSIGSTRDLYLDQKVWVAPAGSDDAAHWHGGRVTRINEAHFFLSLDDPQHVTVKEGGKLHCRLWREEDARYSFDALLVRKENRPAGWMLAHTEHLSRTQDRSHFRISHDQAAEIGIVEAPRGGDYSLAVEKEAVAVLQGRVTSLSGGGFAVAISQPLPPQVLLRVSIRLDSQGGVVSAHGKVVGSQSLFGGRYLIRCAFVELAEEERDHITQYVFRRQTQQRAALES